MRKLYSLICYCCLALGLSGQEAPKASDNIVPNPGFERYSSTPIGWFYKGSHFTAVMKYWSSATGASPDAGICGGVMVLVNVPLSPGRNELVTST